MRTYILFHRRKMGGAQSPNGDIETLMLEVVIKIGGRDVEEFYMMVHLGDIGRTSAFRLSMSSEGKVFESGP